MHVCTDSRQAACALALCSSVFVPVAALLRGHISQRRVRAACFAGSGRGAYIAGRAGLLLAWRRSSTSVWCESVSRKCGLRANRPAARVASDVRRQPRGGARYTRDAREMRARCALARGEIQGATHRLEFDGAEVVGRSDAGPSRCKDGELWRSRKKAHRAQTKDRATAEATQQRQRSAKARSGKRNPA
eukprot:4882588-Pleurochrysis_carterae.AAC.5